MELKAPTPLGEKFVKKDPVQQHKEVQPKEVKTKIQLPKLNIHIPKINFSFLSKIKIPEGKKRKVLEISLIAVPVTLLIVLLILIINFVTTEPYRMANTFLDKIDNGNINSAYEMTTEAYKATNSTKSFREICTKLNSVDISHPKIISKSIEEIPGMGKYAYITYKISGYEVNVTVFNDTVDWGIHSIELSLLD